MQELFWTIKWNWILPCSYVDEVEETQSQSSHIPDCQVATEWKSPGVVVWTRTSVLY